MARKLSTLLAAVAVVALAVPAMASASPTATNTAGTSLATGTKVRKTAITTSGNPKLTSTILGEIECNGLSITGELKTNSGGTVTGNSGGEFTSATCTNKGNPVTVTSITLGDLVTTVSGKATASFTSVIDVAGLPCTFTGTSIPGTYTLGTAVVTFSKAGTVDGSPAGCGNGTFDGVFTLEYEVPGTPPVWHDMVIS